MASKYADQEEKFRHHSGFEPRAFTWFSLSAQKSREATYGVEPQLLAEIQCRATCAGRKLRYSFVARSGTANYRSSIATRYEFRILVLVLVQTPPKESLGSITGGAAVADSLEGPARFLPFE